MEGILGRIIEVYLPDRFKKIDAKKIGFKVKTANSILNVIVPIDDDTANIYKDDLVIIKKQKISNKEFITIDHINEDYYE